MQRTKFEAAQTVNLADLGKQVELQPSSHRYKSKTQTNRTN